MSHWIKIGSCLYNLDKVSTIETEARFPQSVSRHSGVRIVFNDQDWTIFLGEEAEAIRMYLAVLVQEQTITDLTGLVEPLPTVDTTKDGGA